MEEKIKEKNLYVGIVVECMKRVDGIRGKIGFITASQVGSDKMAETPSRNELEGELKTLLYKIQELENDILV